MNPLKRLNRLIVSIIFLSSGFTATANAAPLKVAMFSGAAEYKSDDTLAGFKKFIEQNYRASCTLNLVTRLDDLPGIEQLDSCDVMLVFTRRLNLPDEQVTKLKKYCESGRGVVGVRTASHAFQTWLEFDKLVLGGNYNNHHKEDRAAKISVDAKAKDHPVLAGFAPFTTMGKLYKNPALAPDAALLLSASTDAYSEPVAWARERHGGRAFYTSLGVPADFEDPNFRRLLVNALFWAARRDVEPHP